MDHTGRWVPVPFPSPPPVKCQPGRSSAHPRSLSKQCSYGHSKYPVPSLRCVQLHSRTMASQPSEPQPSATADPAPPLSPDGTVNDDTADPTFDPSSLDPDIDMNIDPSPSTQLQDAQTDGPTNDPTQQNGISIEPSKQPLQKDVSLKEFLEKMDDYTPIVSCSPHTSPHKTSVYINMLTTKRTGPSDPRRSNLPPPPPRRPPSRNNTPTPRPPPCARHPEIHRRHRRRRLPVLAHASQRQRLRHHHSPQPRRRRWWPKRQRAGWSGGRSKCGFARGGRDREGEGGRACVWDAAGGVWWWGRGQ